MRWLPVTQTNDITRLLLLLAAFTMSHCIDDDAIFEAVPVYYDGDAKAQEEQQEREMQGWTPCDLPL